MKTRPRLAVWKFASCDGCQLTLLNCEDELLQLAGALDVACFPEASRAMARGPYDISLVEGSITTPHDAERIHQVRRQSRILITIGACATAGGIQALRNFKDVKEFTSAVYASPQFIETLGKSTPISDHVRVDYELRGCPIQKGQLLEVITALLHGRKPSTPAHAVCVDCKRSGTVCVMVAHGTPCLGPVTHAGCRRDLPLAPPRLLRLLRPQGDAQHGVAERRAPVPGRRRGGAGPPVPQFQRLCRTVPAGE